jgi:hypothetical protein
MPSLFSRFSCAVLAGGFLLRGPSIAAQGPSIPTHPHVQQILLLQGVDRGNLVVDSFTANFRVDLDKRVGRPVNVVQVVVSPTGFVGAPEQAVVDYVRSTFANRPKPDLVMTVAGPAAAFARKYRPSSFPTRRSCSPLPTGASWAMRPSGRTRRPWPSPTIFLG